MRHVCRRCSLNHLKSWGHIPAYVCACARVGGVGVGVGVGWGGGWGDGDGGGGGGWGDGDGGGGGGVAFHSICGVWGAVCLLFGTVYWSLQPEVFQRLMSLLLKSNSLNISYNKWGILHIHTVSAKWFFRTNNCNLNTFLKMFAECLYMYK